MLSICFSTAYLEKNMVGPYMTSTMLAVYIYIYTKISRSVRFPPHVSLVL